MTRPARSFGDTTQIFGPSEGPPHDTHEASEGLVAWATRMDRGRSLSSPGAARDDTGVTAFPQPVASGQIAPSNDPGPEPRYPRVVGASTGDIPGKNGSCIIYPRLRVSRVLGSVSFPALRGDTVVFARCTLGRADVALARARAVPGKIVDIIDFCFEQPEIRSWLDYFDDPPETRVPAEEEGCVEGRAVDPDKGEARR